MYTWEMEKFINQRDKRIGGDDLLKIISQEENPQIKVVRYIAGNKGGSYQRSVREAQSINSDVRAKGSVEQNRGLTNRNLL